MQPAQRLSHLVEGVEFNGGDEVVAQIDDLQTASSAEPLRRDPLDPVAAEINGFESVDPAQVDRLRQPVLLQVKSAQASQRRKIVQPLQAPAFEVKRLNVGQAVEESQSE